MMDSSDLKSTEEEKIPTKEEVLETFDSLM